MVEDKLLIFDSVQTDNKSWSAVEDYFYIPRVSEKLGFRRFSLLNNRSTTYFPCRQRDTKTSEKVSQFALSFLKILSYFTLIVPIGFLIARTVYRKRTPIQVNNKYHSVPFQIWKKRVKSERVHGGVHQTIKFRHLDKDLFFKPLSKGEQMSEISREVSASKLAKVLTGGLVPSVKPAVIAGKMGSIQRFINMDQDLFKKLYCKNKKNKQDFSFLNTNQRHQLLVHILADRLISNWDLHHKHFGISGNRDVITIDKGHGFRTINLKGIPNQFVANSTHYEPHHRLAINENHWVFSLEDLHRWGLQLVNIPFVKQIKKGLITISLKDPQVQAFFKRCESIKKSRVKKILAPFYMEIKKESREKFLDLIFSRIKNIRKKTTEFFGSSQNT